MKFALALVLGAASVATAQGVTALITPTGAAPPGCTGSVEGDFQIAAGGLPASKRSLAERDDACGNEKGTLRITLKDGIMKDNKGRTAYIADNFQFQFDGPPQTGAIYTGGFSACKNNTIALGSSNVFYACLSGSFNNLYDRSWAAQCQPIEFNILPCSAAASSSATPSTSTVVIAASSASATSASSAAASSTTEVVLSETSGGVIAMPTSMIVPPAANVSTATASSSFASVTGAANLSSTATPTASGTGSSTGSSTSTAATGGATAVGATTGLAAMVFGVAALAMF